jgi:hypothetical protein
MAWLRTLWEEAAFDVQLAKGHLSFIDPAYPAVQKLKKWFGGSKLYGEASSEATICAIIDAAVVAENDDCEVAA